MAVPSGFLQTLLGKFTEQSAVLQPENRAMEWVTADIGFNTAEVGETINVPVSVPVDGQVVVQSGVGYTAPTYNAYAVNTVPVKLTTLISYSVAVPAIDKLNTDQDIVRLLVNPAFKALGNKVNGVITALMNATNFNVNAPISTTGGIITTDQFLQAKTALEDQFVNTEDPGNVALIQKPLLYNRTLNNPAWSQESIVGAAVAAEARVLGVNRVAFGASMAKDQLMTTTGTPPSRTFTSWYGTKDAIAVAYRPVPAGDAKYVDATYIPYKGMMFLLELSYNPKDRQNYMNFMGAMGAKVIRPEQGQIITTAE